MILKQRFNREVFLFVCLFVFAVLSLHCLAGQSPVVASVFLFFAVLSLHCLAGQSTVVASGGYFLVVVCGLLIVVACLVVAHSFWGTQASVAAASGLSSCTSGALEHRLNSGMWAQLLCCMRDLPGPGMGPVPPALAGGFLTTEPPGKPKRIFKTPKIQLKTNNSTAILFEGEKKEKEGT